jgi:hypothetical protein
MISGFRRKLIFFGNFFVPFIITTIMEIYYNISNITSSFTFASITLSVIISLISLVGFSYLLYLINQSTKLGYEKRDVYIIRDRTKLDLTFYLILWSIIIVLFYFLGICTTSDIYVIIGIMIGILLPSNEEIGTIFYNPILYFIGYRVYQVNFKNDDHDIYIISNKRLEKGTYKFYMITDYLFYYNKKLIGKEGDKK